NDGRRLSGASMTFARLGRVTETVRRRSMRVCSSLKPTTGLAGENKHAVFHMRIRKSEACQILRWLRHPPRAQLPSLRQRDFTQQQVLRQLWRGDVEGIR